MRPLSKVVLATAIVSLLSVTANAQSVLIGSPPDPASGNCFPFGCSSGTRYQQVYAASNFTTGAVFINSIRFFHSQLNPGGGTYASGVYQMYLSTTSAAVGALDANMANNVGGNNTFFGTFSLSGSAAAPTLDFVGNAFAYAPSGGNLLLDILASYTATGNVFLDARNNTATANDFSRMHDYGAGFAGYGLVTEFGTTTVTPEPGTLVLLGSGLAGLGLVVSRRKRRS